MLLLDPGTPEDQKTKILADTEASIAKLGEVANKHDYGVRPTTFEIDKKTEAEYHLIQFHGHGRAAGGAEPRRCASPMASCASASSSWLPAPRRPPDLTARAAARAGAGSGPRRRVTLDPEEAAAAAAVAVRQLTPRALLSLSDAPRLRTTPQRMSAKSGLIGRF